VSSGILLRLPWNRSVRADNVAVVMAEDMTLRDRARGALLGLACGDALGAPFEGQPSVRAADLAAWAAAAAPLRVTDDTVLTLAVAEHLADRGGQVDQDALALALARAWLADPGRGYGGAVQDLFARVLEGTWWREASGAQFGGAGSWGNGAAMRVAPAGVAAVGMDRVAELAQRSAAVTHAHPLGQVGAVVQACAVALAAASAPDTPVDRAAWCRRLAAAAAAPAYASALRQVAGLGPDAAPGAVAAAVGNGVAAVEAVPAALAAFLAHPDRPADAIGFAIRVGGDTDTIAAMTGALAGARCGASALPRPWLRRLEFAGQLAAAADRLAEMTGRPGGQGTGVR
jgi:poly(ADP-ribose) glycohydrolase ARH3